MFSFIDDDHEKVKLSKTGKIENDNDREIARRVHSDVLAVSDGWYVLSVKLWNCDPASGRRRIMCGSESSYLLLEDVRLNS
ncbi:hypothetical protein T4D_11685 [Trichinella pseudospiralis]|uniref:Uncharacterized protein n=1 Tax=Trichinella pseudospiralis TaxID=6337 RepID=A0A0V1FVC3_TRIPS|nr:hypothetical protein T4D_11685 [Trichinella pseudospiralis]